MWRIAFAALILAATAAAAQENPAGDCGLRRDGSRAGYHYAEASSWMPDCGNPLRREYWRVFLKHDGTAYVIPRPDADTRIRTICAMPEHELRSLVDKYALCTPAPSQEWVRVVNSMIPSDALRITHFLHGQLKFQVVRSPVSRTLFATQVSPYPIPSDVVDACEIRRSSASAEFQRRCQEVADALQGKGRLNDQWFGDVTVELASRLNELYGVPQ